MITATRQDHAQDPFGEEQRNDPDVKEILDFLEQGTLPEDNKKARRIALQESLLAIVDGILYSVDLKHNNQKRVVMPRQLREQILKALRSYMPACMEGLLRTVPLQCFGESLVVGRDV